MLNYLAQSYLDNTRELTPNRTAVSCSTDSITYEELCIFSNKLANCLISKGVVRQDRVAFCLKRSVNSLVAIFGILKADCIYVPIDPKSPLKRCRAIIDDCEPSTLICDSETIDKMLQTISDIQFMPKRVIVEHNEGLPKAIENGLITRAEIEEQDSKKPDYKNVDTDIAYILYTSGSTGNPKGVMISHLNITNYIKWAIDCFDITRKDNILSTAPFHFDMSTFDIYCAMGAGARLCIATESCLLFPNKLLSLIEKEQITIWKAISSLIMYLAKTGSLKEGRIPTLKKVLFSGEVLPTKHLIPWMETYPEKLFYNAYGPTEATGISTYYHVQQIPKDPQQPIPIGRPCTNTDVFLLNEDDSLAEVGELCIRGSSLSRGYWNDPEKTNKVFVTNPLNHVQGDRIYRTRDLAKLRNDGNYIFIGRRDNQIKHMGYRIEPFEIENAILSLNKVDDAAVILSKSQEFDIEELVAFFAADEDVTSDEIMTELRNCIPHYMLPQHIIELKHIPRTDRGKIDRGALNEYYLSYQSQVNSRVLDAKH